MEAMSIFMISGSELLPCGVGAPSGTALGQARQLATQAALPAIRERRPSGLRRFWGSSASSRAPSVASQASSEQDLAGVEHMGSSAPPSSAPPGDGALAGQQRVQRPRLCAGAAGRAVQGVLRCCLRGALMTLLCPQARWLGRVWLL